MTATETTIDLLEWLDAEYFSPNEDLHGDWFDRGDVRVGFDDADVVIYRFKLGGLAWYARFSNAAPLEVLAAAIKAALTE